MSTIGLKLGSLVIRTLSKPIANAIKDQARDHPQFRRLCIRIAQSIHRTDMRLRLGILRDTAAIAQHEATEKAASAATKASSGTAASASTSSSTATATGAAIPKTASTSATTTSSSSTSPKTNISHAAKAGAFNTTFTPKYNIRPLSESKAIDRGANFISEFFLFTVGGSLILFESIRARRKESARRDIVAERLELLEERNRQDEERLEKLEEEVWRLKGGREEEREVVKAVPLWEGRGAKVGVLKGVWRRVTKQSGDEELGEEEKRESNAESTHGSASLSSPPSPVHSQPTNTNNTSTPSTRESNPHQPLRPSQPLLLSNSHLFSSGPDINSPPPPSKP